jgi:hypothetical protein
MLMSEPTIAAAQAAQKMAIVPRFTRIEIAAAQAAQKHS